MLFKDTNIGRLILEHVSMEKSADQKVPFDASQAAQVAEGLAKIASYQYNEKVYESVQEMMKIASKCLINLKSAFDAAMEKNAHLQKSAEVHAIIEDMANNGLIGEHELREKVAELMSKSNDRLEIVKEAVKLASGGKNGNIFFNEPETVLTKTASREKVGMFDNVISS
jgi:YesN/AraC family two-component response regulator